ncbi:helix-turn-helix domain-containing protein [Kitasatospora sp. MBT66]|uniref:helix-turn-helix domain-containing protein n=1 Tax=Kitasatospora sp. MBT66 TaxID=1444769 RepID=UPI0005BE9027|nr:helix-turn-helix transcriptional regulator [Kitasatospora sp. MBT66]
MMVLMERDWARLGSLLRAGRQAGGSTQDELGALIGVTRNALATIEKGEARRVTSTIRSYAREVGWAEGSVERVLAGGEPVLREPGDEPEPPSSQQDPGRGPAAVDAARAIADALVARLPQRVLQELADGHVIDTDVLDLRPDGSVALMTLVLERSEDLPPAAQVRDDLREWSRVQRGLRGVVQDQMDPGERPS